MSVCLCVCVCVCVCGVCVCVSVAPVIFTSSSLQLVGPPGSGKTQLCLTVALTTALPPACGGCGMGVVFIDTEATFSASRHVWVTGVAMTTA